MKPHRFFVPRMWTCRTLEWSGAVTGIAGAVLLALNVPYSGIGFVFFLMSNVFLIAYGCLRQASGIITMQVFFSLTSLLGIYRWLVMT